jgi:peroxiredoxin
MKKKIKLLVAITLLSIVGYLGYNIASTLNYKNEVTKRIQSIPNFSFHDLNGDVYTEKNLPNKSIIFIYFNSNCEYCQSKATKIQQRLSDFKETQLVFVSFEEAASIKLFATAYKLDNQENIIFLEDRKGQFSHIFDVHSIPYIVVYDADRKFLQKFKGATKIDNILEVIKIIP